jgi:hypothetical protein
MGNRDFKGKNISVSRKNKTEQKGPNHGKGELTDEQALFQHYI